MRPWVRRGFELVTVCSFAVAQPVFDVLGRNATFFVAQGAGLGGILLLVVLLVVALPLAVLVVERIVAFASPTASRVLHIGMVSSFIAITATPPAERALRHGAMGWATVALVVFAVAAFLYVRFERFRALLAWTALSAIVFAGTFLFLTDVRGLIVPAEEGISLPPGRSPTPVVFLLLDELQLGSLLTPEGTIDATRYPTFAELGRTATWYPNATTTGESTQWASPSLLSGRWLSEKVTPTYRNYPDNLFTYVRRSQPVYATEYVSRVCAPTVCERVGVDPGVGSLLTDAAVVYLHTTLPAQLADEWLPPLVGRWAGFAAPPAPAKGTPAPATRADPAHWGFIGWVERDIRDDQLARFNEMVSTIEAGRAPALWYLHIGIPHVPWRFLPSGQTYQTERRRVPGLDAEIWLKSQTLVDQGLQRYLLQLRFTDSLVGELIRRLRDQDLFDRSLFVVAADHGVSFRPGISRRHIDEENVGDIVPVPLFVKYPGQDRGRVDRRNAEIIDVLPTILDVLGIEGGDVKLDGSSLRGPDPERPQKRVFSGVSGAHVYGPMIEGIEERSRRIWDLFGPPGGPHDLYAFGPHGALVGTDAGERPADPSSRVRIENPGFWDAVDLDGAFVPALVRANFAGAIGPEQPIAVSLDGTIAGVGWTFKEGKKVKMSLMVSPEYLREGKNEVDVFRITSDGDLQLIRPIG